MTAILKFILVMAFGIGGSAWASQADSRVMALTSVPFETAREVLLDWAAAVALSEGSLLDGKHTVKLDENCWAQDDTAVLRGCILKISANEASKALGLSGFETIMLRFYELKRGSPVSAVEVLPGMNINDGPSAYERAAQCRESGRALSSCFALSAWFTPDGLTVTYKDGVDLDLKKNLFLNFRSDGGKAFWRVQTQLSGYSADDAFLTDSNYSGSYAP